VALLNASSIDLRNVVLKIQEAVGSIEIECYLEGPRYNERTLSWRLREFYGTKYGVN